MAQALRGVAKAADGIARAFGGWDDVARVALAAFAVSKLLKIAAAVRGIGTAAYFSAGGFRAMAAGAATSAGAAGGAGRAAGGAGRATGRRGFGAIPIGGGAAGVVSALVFSGQIGLPGGLDSGNAREPILKAQELFRVDQAAGIKYARKHGVPLSLLSADFAAAERIRAPGEGRPAGSRARRARKVKRTGAGGGGGKTGDGLSGIQRLELAAGRAELTTGLSDDLAAARKIAAYYRYRERITKKTGSELFAIKQDTIAAEQRVTAIQDQIEQAAIAAEEKRAANARRAAETRANNARRAAEKRARHQRRQTELARKAQTGPASSSRPPKQTMTESESAASAAAQIREFLVRFQDTMTEYGPNIRPAVTVNQHFTSTAPLPTIDELARSARYANFHFRHSLAG
jgi:hypothetical protein